MKTVLLALIRFYRRCISPLYPACCRFYPTCSTYALEAVSRHGAVRGGFLAVIRFFKCNPLHKGGYDPVPETFGLLGRRSAQEQIGHRV